MAIKLKQIQGGLELKQDVTSLKEQLADYSVLVEDVETLKEDVATLTAGEETEGSVAHAVAEAKKELQEQIDEKVDTLQGEVDALEERVTANEGSIVSLGEKDVELEGKITAAEGEIANLKAKDVELAGKISANEQAIADLNTRVDDEVAARTEAIQGVQDEIGAVEGKVNALETKTAQDILDAKTETLEAAKEYADEKIAEANQSLNGLEERVATLEGEMDSVEEGLAQEILDRDAADKVLEAKIVSVETRTETLETEMDAVESEVVRVEGKVDALEAKVTADIKTAVDTAKAYTDEREVEINKVIVAGDEATLTSAKEYADGVAGQSLEDAKLYTDEKVAGLKSELVSPEEGQALDVKLGNVIVSGDLEVKGAVKSIARTELHIEDSIIEVNSAGADVTTSDVHLGLRANLGEDLFSELVYCPDSQKWVVRDNHPAVQALYGADHVVKTIAYVEDMVAGNEELQEQLDAVSGKVDANAEAIEAVEERLDAIEAAPTQQVEKIENPTNVITLKAEPVDGKVQLFINGLAYEEGFTVIGSTLTWGDVYFEIEEDDVVIARYMA